MLRLPLQTNKETKGLSLEMIVPLSFTVIAKKCSGTRKLKVRLISLKDITVSSQVNTSRQIDKQQQAKKMATRTFKQSSRQQYRGQMTSTKSVGASRRHQQAQRSSKRLTEVTAIRQGLKEVTYTCRRLQRWLTRGSEASARGFVPFAVLTSSLKASTSVGEEFSKVEKVGKKFLRWRFGWRRCYRPSARTYTLVEGCVKAVDAR